MFERRVKRLMTPRTWDTPDAEGFREYAKEHYGQMLDLAVELVGTRSWTATGGLILAVQILPALFDKLAAPLVYLYESWEVLSPEEKAKYSPELAKIHEESKILAEKALPGVAPGVPVVKPEEAAKIPHIDLGDLDNAPWMTFRTKVQAPPGTGAWIKNPTYWTQFQAPAVILELTKALKAAPGELLTLGDMLYSFSQDGKFIRRMPVKKKERQE